MGRQINFDYHIVPYPVGPSGTGESSGQGYGDYFVIPRGVKDPEKVYQVLEEFYGYHGDDLDYRDEDKLSLVEGCFIDEADIEMALDMVYWSNGDDWTLIDAPVDGVTLVASIYGGIVSGETTPIEAVESHKQLFQTKIDEILNSNR
jgi:multiple sugar transport system substrate-binding protein